MKTSGCVPEPLSPFRHDYSLRCAIGRSKIAHNYPASGIGRQSVEIGEGEICKNRNAPFGRSMGPCVKPRVAGPSARAIISSNAFYDFHLVLLAFPIFKGF